MLVPSKAFFSPSKNIVYLNGKFYSSRINGVHRVADRIICTIDKMLAADCFAFPSEFVLLVPKNYKWLPSLEKIKIEIQKNGEGQIWEQTVLSWRARDGLLVNLCNLAPIFHRKKILLLHDAQFRFPDSSYPRAMRWWYRFLTPLMARTSRQIWTVSDYSRQMLDLLKIASREKTTVIKNGSEHILDRPSDPALFIKFCLKKYSYVLHVASPKSYKNTEIVFKAFEREALQDLSLVLIGSSRAELENAGFSPPRNAVFVGVVEDPSLRAFYESALCLLFPSRTEGFGLPPVEAMMCGCPSVVAPAGAIPEICRDAVSYANVSDPEDWVAAIIRYRDDKVFRNAKIELGRARASEFTWAVAGEKIFSLLMNEFGSKSP